MPHYYFHVHNSELVCDDEGLDQADDTSALAFATDSARRLAAHHVEKGQLDLSNSIEVIGENDRPVGRVYFRDAITVSL